MSALRALLAVVCLVTMSGLSAGAQHHSGEHPKSSEQKHQTGDSATVHHRFEDADRWAEVFEDPERDAWQKPDLVIKQLHLAKDAVVADIGSATGYFSVRFAAAVPEGKVYGVDIESGMVDYLNSRAEKEALTNLVSILGEPDDPKLPEPVDMIFICDTYHHIGSRVQYFHRLIEKLKPGGRIVNVDFRPGELPVGPKPDHKLDPERVIAEMFAAGFELSNTNDQLPYQYVQEFTVRPEFRLKAGDLKDNAR